LKFYFSLCLLLSSSLLMLVQPIAARMLLPSLGGSPGVWNTCMVFFQTGLLAGYAYAHFGPRSMGIGRHAAVHGLLLIAAAALLPIHLAAPDAPPAWPTLWLLTTLTLGVGVPYVLLASASSLLQMWFAICTDEDPYSLYAASNLGSFIGLFAYPFVVEPALALQAQADAWRMGFAAFAGLSLVAIGLVWRPLKGGAEMPRRTVEPSAPPAKSRIVRWILLALAPSSLMLSVTTHVTTDLAPAPFLWAIPLGLYLLTFVVAFSRRPILPHAIVVRYLPIAIFFLVFLWLSDATSPLVIILIVDLIGFAWLALFCHGELAASRPRPDRLTAFYFWIALGGVLGGAFNVLIAPLVFSAYVEYPLMIVVVAALRPVGLSIGRRAEGVSPPRDGIPSKDAGGSRAPVPRRADALRSPNSVFADARQRLLKPVLIGGAGLAFVLLGRFLDIPSGPTFLIAVTVPLLATIFVHRSDSYALAVALILATGLLWPGIHGDIIERRRSFFGVHRVTQDLNLIKLVHGNTVHGMQAPLEPREPLAYYHRGSPIGVVIERMTTAGRLKNVGVVGLGSGALAAYGQNGQNWTFFEIDPDVRAIAQTHFTYLARCPAEVRIVLGDARLTLQNSIEAFDLLVIDAFGSDSIPTHLLTREAMDIYAAHLKPGGIVAFHVSNRYVNLLPVLGGLAEFGWQGFASDPDGWPVSDKDQAAGRLSSWWAVLARDHADLADSYKGAGWVRLTPSPGFRPWSDDFINLAAVVRWRDMVHDE
jgi:SAM-dependent methyltransferase